MPALNVARMIAVSPLFGCRLDARPLFPAEGGAGDTRGGHANGLYRWFTRRAQ